MIASLLGWFSACSLGPLLAAEESEAAKAAAPAEHRSVLAAVDSADDLILLERSTRGLPPVSALPDEGTIARITARLLAQQHYSRHPFDDDVSSRFLERYLDSLDNLRLHFLESDLQEFEKYRTRLDDLTKKGDTAPAREIFSRFLERLEQRVTYVAELLKTETFHLDADEEYLIDRRKARRPKDLEEARSLWRKHLHFEVLQEKLSAKKPRKTSSAASTNETASAAAPPETATTPKAQTAPTTPNGLSEEVVKTISRRYARLLKTLRDFDGADVLQYYLSSLARVYDPHSDYLGKASLENFAINMSLSLFGIGAVLQSEDGYCKVRELRPGPAMRSKQIKPGDRIIAVAQGDDEPVDVVDMKLNKVVEMVRGPKGTKVRLTMIPVDAADPSERKEVVLVRDEISLEDEEARAKLVEMPVTDGRTVRIGIIDLPSFYASLDLGARNGRGRPRSTTLDVARLIDRLKQEKVEGIILDLRRNGGGSLEEAIDLTGLFIKEGVVVQVRGPDGTVFKDEDPENGVLYDGPLVVLTSRHSASASEILAAALQDYGRALIVGDSSTHGKGTVQSLIQLRPLIEPYLESTNNPGALKVTVRKFYRPTGGSTQLKGVTPDVVLPSLNDYAEVGESSLDDPLVWDTIPAALFDGENRILPLLKELRRRSEERVAKDQDWQYVQQDIELYRQRQETKTVSLNEAVRLREREENEQRLEARKQERKARKEPPEKTYEITLKNVDAPGLTLASATNTTSQTSGSLSALTADDDTDGLPDEADSIPDVTLKEARQILLDLIQLSRNPSRLAQRP